MKPQLQHYNVAIIGGGIGGLMTAYRLSKKNSDLKIVLFESGKDIEHRICPMIKNASGNCVSCPTCCIMRGMAGAGAFSDGKYTITTEYGGWLSEIVKNQNVLNYIEQADDILVEYGATTKRYMPDNELKYMCLTHDLHMLQAELKHLGTDNNFKIMQRMINDLKSRIEILTCTPVADVDSQSHTVFFTDNGERLSITADSIVFAVGRAGSSFLGEWCTKNKIPLINNQVDVGVRVELPRLIWEDFAKKIYEPKIVYRTKAHGDFVRVFCFNDGGNVIIENTDGVLSVNGHSYSAEELKTKNSNFALLSTTRFTEPFNQPIEYAKEVALLANKISGGSVLVQRFGDLVRGNRTNEKGLKKSTTIPTLNAVAGDLGLCMPKRQLDNIIETLYALDKIAPGTANEDTLLYGIETKYYSARPKMNKFMLDGTSGIYALGDGAGITRSLAQASANGLIVADLILKEKIDNIFIDNK